LIAVEIQITAPNHNCSRYTRPAITCPVNVTINCEASTAPSNTGTATATDNCTDVVTNITFADSRTMEVVMIITTLARLWTCS
jgi:hypothetical protein